MPDPITLTTFTALPALTEVPANNDVLGLDDTSATATKSILAGFLRRAKVDSVIASGSLTLNALHFVTLNLGTAIALTILAAPSAGDILVIYRKGSGAVTHTVTLTSPVKWNPANNTIASFDTDGDCLIAIAETAALWTVLPFSVGVTFS